MDGVFIKTSTSKECMLRESQKVVLVSSHGYLKQKELYSLGKRKVNINENIRLGAAIDL